MDLLTPTASEIESLAAHDAGCESTWPGRTCKCVLRALTAILAAHLAPVERQREQFEGALVSCRSARDVGEDGASGWLDGAERADAELCEYRLRSTSPIEQAEADRKTPLPQALRALIETNELSIREDHDGETSVEKTRVTPVASPRHLRLSDGTTWPRPALNTDDDSVAWKLRYAPDQMTRAEQMHAASIVEAYGYLLLETTRERRNQVVRDIKAHLTAEARQ